MKLSQFLKDYVSTWECPEFDVKCINRLSYSTTILPSDYLNYAQVDLQSNLQHKHINTLSNTKRAIDCQLDNIFSAFGLPKKHNFPSKLEIIGEIGLIAPRIVRKVVRIRNMLEHDYYNPNQDEVEDAVDIATLFLEATSRPFRSFMEDFFIADKASAQDIGSDRIVSRILNGENQSNGYTFTESFYVSFDKDEKVFWIDCVHNDNPINEIEISSKHPFYKKMIRFAFEYDQDHHNYAPEQIGVAFVHLMKNLADDNML